MRYVIAFRHRILPKELGPGKDRKYREETILTSRWVTLDVTSSPPCLAQVSLNHTTKYMHRGRILDSKANYMAEFSRLLSSPIVSCEVDEPDSTTVVFQHRPTYEERYKVTAHWVHMWRVCTNYSDSLPRLSEMLMILV